MNKRMHITDFLNQVDKSLVDGSGADLLASELCKY